ncbi:hypothetical protein K469DRAFT_10483 [Zopfia rhizophila CBS 207.26]|uniref:Uncharacterized protein n=1 Tax=Zopfia rhizophila CBS 207.26 TaxID=1314779 RepID=A0A6A6EWL3_9PEZI|nr:hypothetical protein K469DRAFT_10483 [Zopfia rhizophila CBS 207.26]
MKPLVRLSTTVSCGFLPFLYYPGLTHPRVMWKLIPQNLSVSFHGSCVPCQFSRVQGNISTQTQFTDDINVSGTSAVRPSNHLILPTPQN